MASYRDAIELMQVRIGVADMTNPVPAKVVRAQATMAAVGPTNTKKKYFGYGRLVPQADIAPEDQILTKNSDSADDMDIWLDKASGDPQMIWAGFFDNATGKLVRDTIGDAIVVSPDKPAPAPKKSGMGLAIGLIAGGGALMLLGRKGR